MSGPIFNGPVCNDFDRYGLAPNGLAQLCSRLSGSDFAQFIDGLDNSGACAFLHDWRCWARPEQWPPDGDWRIWLILAGRGFGKTRTGAEWVHMMARATPAARIALIGASLTEVRSVMVEGESGLLATARPDEHILWEPSLRRLRWPCGAQAIAYSAAEPESLRGPQHSHAWCDEIAKWDVNDSGRADAAWNNMMMGLRLGPEQRVTATTTPRAVSLVKRLLAEPDVVVTRGRMRDNAAHLPSGFIAAMEAGYAGTTLGRQELDGELIVDREGALWSRSLLEDCRVGVHPAVHDAQWARVVVAVDPPASIGGDACGIVVAAMDDTGRAHVLADASVENLSPEGWARKTAETVALWGADRVVAEANQGGAMVRAVLTAADIALPVRLVHATRGKVARAEPVAALYEAGRVHHHGVFAALEDQLCGLMPGGAYVGPGRSPDRADALVWALSELMLGGRGEPLVRVM